MKVKLISFVLLLAAFALSCTHKNVVDNRKPANDAGDISPFVLLPSNFKCQAMSEDMNTDLGDVKVSVENGENPLITVSSETDKKLDFKIGRKNISGGEYSQRHDIDCKFDFDQASGRYSAVYACGPKPLPAKLTVKNIQKLPFKSIFIFNPDDLGGEIHEICRTTSACINLRNCAAIK